MRNGKRKGRGAKFREKLRETTEALWQEVHTRKNSTNRHARRNVKADDSDLLGSVASEGQQRLAQLALRRPCAVGSCRLSNPSCSHCAPGIRVPVALTPPTALSKHLLALAASALTRSCRCNQRHAPAPRLLAALMYLYLLDLSSTSDHELFGFTCHAKTVYSFAEHLRYQVGPSTCDRQALSSFSFDPS
eukprot:664318-Hanusia_phi.AAC.2